MRNIALWLQPNQCTESRIKFAYNCSITKTKKVKRLRYATDAPCVMINYFFSLPVLLQKKNAKYCAVIAAKTKKQKAQDITLMYYALRALVAPYTYGQPPPQILPLSDALLCTNTKRIQIQNKYKYKHKYKYRPNTLHIQWLHLMLMGSRCVS